MTIESIITDGLCIYPGLPDFCIVQKENWYSCLFEDGIKVDFKVKSVPSKELANFISKTIYESYLQQTHNYGMNSK